MRELFSAIITAAMLLITACGNSEGSIQNSDTISNSDTPQSSGSSVADKKTEMYVDMVAKNGDTVSFKLNDSAAARGLYEQLPLSISIEDYAGSEKIFYPPEKLNTENAPAAKGPAGTLAYYAPWGDVAIFYGECVGASGLFKLGNVVSGVEYIAEMTGEIEILKGVGEIISTTSEDATSSSAQGTSSMASTPSSSSSADTSSSSNGSYASLPPQTESTSSAFLTTVFPTTPDQHEPSDITFDSSLILEPTTEMEDNDLSITITANGRTFSANLYDNETAREFKSRLPFTLDMSELNGNEKYYCLPEVLPRNSSVPSGIKAGDIMLYGSDCLVIFYESFSTSYSYTAIGRIDDPEGLANALGSGNVRVTFE